MTSAAADDPMADLLTATKAAVKKRLPAAHEVAHEQLATAISSMLQLDLADLITGAWCNTQAILRGAEDSRRRSEPVTMTTLHMEYETRHDAVLEAWINRLRVEPVPIGLDLELEVDPLELTLKDGCLTEISPGHARLTATLSIGTVALRPPVTQEIDLKKTITLQQPIPLCRPPETERPAGEPPEMVVLPDAAGAQEGQRSARPAGSPPSSDLA